MPVLRPLGQRVLLGGPGYVLPGGQPTGEGGAAGLAALAAVHLDDGVRGAGRLGRVVPAGERHGARTEGVWLHAGGAPHPGALGVVDPAAGVRPARPGGGLGGLGQAAGQQQGEHDVGEGGAGRPHAGAVVCGRLDRDRRPAASTRLERRQTPRRTHDEILRGIISLPDLTSSDVGPCPPTHRHPQQPGQALVLATLGMARTGHLAG